MFEKAADGYYQKAEDLLVSTTDSERKAWYNSPFTQALLASLTGDYVMMFLQFGEGTHIHPTAEQTALEATKLASQVDSAKAVIEKIEEIRDYVESEEGDS